MKLRSGPFEGAGGFVISFSTCGGSEPSRSRKPFGKKSMKTAVRGGLALWKDRARLQGVVYCESVHKDRPLAKLASGYGAVTMDAMLSGERMVHLKQ